MFRNRAPVANRRHCFVLGKPRTVCRPAPGS